MSRNQRAARTGLVSPAYFPNQHALPKPSHSQIDASQTTSAPPLDFTAVNSDYVSLPSSNFFHSGVTHCPIYYPSAHEFADPLSYINKIRPEAELCGICKIVPPKDWNIGFAIDTKIFRFKTRKQPLNEMEGGSRAALKFLDTLQKFHALMGHPMNHLPVIQKHPVDLFSLRNEVRKRGGFQSVTDTKKWNDIARSLGYHTNNSISGHIKSCYAKYIIAFDEYMVNDDVDDDAPSPAADAMAAKDETVSLTRQAAREARARTGSVEERLRQINSVILSSATEISSFDNPNIDPNEYTPNLTPISSIDINSGTSRTSQPQPRRSVRTSAQVPISTSSSPHILPYRIPPEASLSKVVLPENYIPRPGEELCESCGHGHNPQLMVICSDCGRGYHAFCLLPSPLPTHPRTLTEWYCHACVRETAHADFGFEDGHEYTLPEFFHKANQFKFDWFTKGSFSDSIVRSEDFGLPPGSKALYVTELDVEREFWRIIESPAFTVDPVEVEYGADLHTSVHGSGFPTIEQDPTNPYTVNAMNLNVLPTLPGSLLEHIHSGISGCVVPWLYVGMTFSTFCWHSEDHDMYSINYHHWGDTKTWYGVPSSHADDFENVMRATAPDLFSKTPDLLFHITTMLSPAKLVHSRVPVFGCHQRAGEFIVTFPRAYHSGFNHGFNCNEAVNFAPIDWVSWGAKSVISYKKFHKSPVFAHQDILMNVALSKGHELSTATWLGPHLREMVETSRAEWEIAIRRSDPSRHLRTWSIEYMSDPLAPCETQCAECRQFCWFAAVHCPTHEKTFCIDHADACCLDSSIAFTIENFGAESSNPVSCFSKKVAIKYPINVLDCSVTSVEEVAKIPLRWIQKLQAALIDHVKSGTRPSMKEISEIIAQHNNLSINSTCAVSTLQSHIVKCIEWVDTASNFVKRRASRIEGSTPSICSENVDEAHSLLNRASMLFLDTPEVAVLDDLLHRLNLLTSQGNSILERRQRTHLSVNECKMFLQACVKMDFQDIPQFHSITSLVLELDWRQKAVDPLVLSDLNKVMQLIEEAKMIGLTPLNNNLLLELTGKAARGEAWNQRAIEVLARVPVPIEDLDELVALAMDIPVSAPYRDRVQDLHKRIHSWHRSAKSLMDAYHATHNKRSIGHLRLSTEDLRSLISQMNGLPLHPPPFHDILIEELRRVDVWNLKCKKLFVRPNTPKSLEIVLTEAFIHIQPTCDVENDIYVEMDDPNRRLYCFCRTIDNGFMLGCEVCGEFYHCPCIKLSKRDAKKLTYVCPVCDLTQGVPRRTALTPPIELLEDVVREAYLLSFRPPEITTLELINGAVQTLRSTVQQFLQRNMFHRSDVPVIKFYLRKVEGCNVIIPEVSQLRDLVERYAKYVPSDEVYCLCQKAATPLVSMVACDSCNDWFHFPCIKVTAKDLRNACSYTCPLCCYKQHEPYPFGSIEITDQYPPFRNYVAGLRSVAEKSNIRTNRKRKKSSTEPTDLECSAIQSNFPSSVTVPTLLLGENPFMPPPGITHPSDFGTKTSGSDPKKMCLAPRTLQLRSIISPPPPLNPVDAFIGFPNKKRTNRYSESVLGFNNCVNTTPLESVSIFEENSSSLKANSKSLSQLLGVHPIASSISKLDTKQPYPNASPNQNTYQLETLGGADLITVIPEDNNELSALVTVSKYQEETRNHKQLPNSDCAVNANTLAAAAASFVHGFPATHSGHVRSYPFCTPNFYPLLATPDSVTSLYTPTTNSSELRPNLFPHNRVNFVWPISHTCSPPFLTPSGSPFYGAPSFPRIGLVEPNLPEAEMNIPMHVPRNALLFNPLILSKSSLLSHNSNCDLVLSNEELVETVEDPVEELSAKRVL